MATTPLLTKSEFAKLFGCTEQQLSAQYAKNAAGLGKMADKAKSKGGKHNGFTESYLREKSKHYNELSK